jgi:ABC-2 type transport system ATP-binding protein
MIEFVAELGASAVLSSHLLGDIERACDHLIVLCDSRVQVAGEVTDLLATHHRLAAPRDELERLPGIEVIGMEHHGSAIVRTRPDPPPLPYPVGPITLEDLVLAYMTRASTPAAHAGTAFGEVRR